MITRAGEILREAAAAVDGPRNSAHGDKERSFECIAELWDVYLTHKIGSEPASARPPVEALDVALMMVLLKIARSLYGEPITDHFMDMAGYAAIAGELAEKGLRTWAEDDEAEQWPLGCQGDPDREVFGDPAAAEALKVPFDHDRFKQAY